MADNKPQNEISTKLCLNCGTPVASFLSICPFCKQPVSGQPLVPLADNESTLTERPRAAAKPEHVSTPKAETNNSQSTCYKCGQETNLRDQYCSNCKSPTTRTIKSKPRTPSHAGTSFSAPSKNTCSSCDREVAGFLKTCPYCQKKITQPMVETDSKVARHKSLFEHTQQRTPHKKPPSSPQNSPITSSNLTPCPDCGQKISLAAAICPSCGAPGPATRAEKKLDSQANAFASICALIFLVFMLFQCGSDDEPDFEPTTAKASYYNFDISKAGTSIGLTKADLAWHAERTYGWPCPEVISRGKMTSGGYFLIECSSGIDYRVYPRAGQHPRITNSRGTYE